MKISTKLSAMILLIILSTGMLMFFTLSSLNNIFAKADEHQTKNTPLMITTLSLQKDIVQIQQWLTDISATRAKPGFDDGFDEAAKFYESAKNNINKLKKLGGDGQTLSSISQNLDAYYKMGIDMANAYIKDGTDAGNLYMEKFDPYAVKMEESVNGFLELAETNFNAGSMKIESSIKALHRSSLLIFSIVTIISIMIFFFIQNLVIKKIHMFTNVLKDISEGNGDLTKRVEIKSKDEIGTMAKYFNTFADTVHSIVVSVKGLSKDVFTSSEELTVNSQQSATTAEEVAQVIDEIAKTAMNQAEITTEGSEKLMELGSLIEEDSSNIEILTEASEKVNELIKEGLVVIDRLSMITKEVTIASKSVYDNIMKTNENSNKISEASNIITSISEQTKLLALNAAIEAARAGEHGKGFAIVAEEIRKLSIQSAESTKIIDSMVKTLQSNSNNAVKTMLEVDNIYNEQIKNVSVTDRKYKEIADALKESNDAVLIINEAEKQIEHMKNQVLVTMETLSSVAEVNSAGSEEASASIEQQTASIEEIANSSRNLSQMFLELQKLIERFKV
ncbi:methyl-accepting chemotaxis protein [Clostridium sp. UBA1056]|uniref:methyl-accepting chemotaxis protein n=1 Tax=unclassified Clostridium TaxID=2614128 RepID=UPI003216D15A